MAPENQRSAVNVQRSAELRNPTSNVSNTCTFPDPGEGLLWRQARKAIAAGGLVEARAAENLTRGPQQEPVITVGDWFAVIAIERDGFRRLGKSLAHGIYVRIAAIRIGAIECGEDDASCDCSWHENMRSARAGEA